MKNEKKEIKYFSMFTGVGGFELGFENAGSESSLSRRRNENSRSSQDLQSKGSKPSNETSTNDNKKGKYLSEQGTSRTNSLGRGNISDSSTREEGRKSGNAFSCVGFSEIDKYASELLKKKFPTVKNWGDCTKIDPTKLPDFDLLCGGFPCQAFSIAGKRRGFLDTRGTMFFEIVRILKVKRPKTILLENVKGLLNHEEGETFKVILQTLDELGYEVQWMVLNSKFFGVPQNRERVFIIGSLRGTSRSEILPLGEINKDGNEKNRGQLSSTITSTYWKGWGGGRTMIHNVYGGFGEGIRESEISPTIRTPKGGGHLPMVKSDMKIRRLTPTECERLQGFPDGWTEGFSDTQRYKMMGNAVTVPVIKAVVEQMFSHENKI